MAVYGVTAYGAAPPQGYYGAAALTYSVEPMACAPVDYNSIMVTWTNLGGTIAEFRLLRNRSGYPVDENDGEILIDTDSTPGNSYLDDVIIPGTYHYYGVYVLVTIGDLFEWIRAGLTACLMPASHDAGDWLFSLLPVYFQENLNGELTQEGPVNSTLQSYLNVIGWGLDYVWTQYDLISAANDPAKIPIGSLMNLATQLGLPFYPGVSQKIMQQMVATTGHINRIRGTLTGISDNITQMTGWGADVTLSKNIMLEQDHAIFENPVYDDWHPSIKYHLNERCHHQKYYYQCIQEGAWNQQPSGDGSSTDWWEPCLSFTDQGELWNRRTGWRNCYEPCWPSAPNRAAPPGGVWLTVEIGEAGTPSDTATLYVQNVTVEGQHDQTIDLNPDFNGTIYPWTVTGGTATLTDLAGFVGTSALLTPTGGAPVYMTSGISGCASNGPITITAPVYSEAGYSNVFITVNWYDSGLNLLSSSTSSGHSITATTWTTLSYTVSAPSACFHQLIGCQDPIDSSNFCRHVVCHTNTAAETQALETRTLSRLLTDMSTGSEFADPAQVIADGIPVPWTQAYQQWSPTTEYGTGVVAWYQAQPFVSLKASTGITPLIDTASNEWAPIGFDPRIMLTWSAYLQQTGSGSAITATPYAEWYDIHGNFITRVTARTGTTGLPPADLYFDSFSDGWDATTTNRVLDMGAENWSQMVGTFDVNGFGGGAAFPDDPDARTMALVNSGVANTTLGLTIKTNPASGYACGLVARWSDSNDYWRIDQNNIVTVNGGSKNYVATHSTPFAPGDRMTVILNGSNVSVYRNAGSSPVSTYTSAFNSSAVNHGIINELI